MKKISTVMEDLRAMKTLTNFTTCDKQEMFKCFKFYRLQAGKRLFGKDQKLDRYILILKGKVGIYFQELQQLF